MVSVSPYGVRGEVYRTGDCPMWDPGDGNVPVSLGTRLRGIVGGDPQGTTARPPISR